MTYNVFAGNFILNTSAGTQSITGLGFQPKIVFFYGTLQTADGLVNDAQIAHGVAISSTSRFSHGSNDEDGQTQTDSNARIETTSCCNMLVPGQSTTLYSFDFDTQDTDGFTIDLTDEPAQGFRVGFLALGGDELTDVFIGNFETNNSLGTQAITGVGFQPDAVMFYGLGRATQVDFSGADLSISLGYAISSTERIALAQFTNNVRSTSETSSTHVDTEAYWGYANGGGKEHSLDFETQDSDGFTVDITEEDPNFVHFVCLRGGQYSIGTFQSQTSAGAFSVTGVGFSPLGAFFNSALQTSLGEEVPHAGWSQGITSGPTEQFALGDVSQDAVGTSRSDTFHDDDRVHLSYDFASTKTGDFRLTGFGADGFDFDQIDPDPTAIQVSYLAIGGSGSIPNAVSGSITPAGALTKETSHSLTGSTTPDGNLLKKAAHSLAGSLTPSGLLVSATTFVNALAGSLTPSGIRTSVITFANALAGSITPSGTLANFAKKVHAGSLTPFGNVVNNFIGLLVNLVSGSVIPEGALTKRILHALEGSTTPDGELVSQAQKLHAGSITPDGALTSVLLEFILNPVEGSLTPTGDLVSKALKIHAGSITPDGTLVRQPQMLHTGSITPTGALTSVIGELFLNPVSGSLTPSGELVSQAQKLHTGSTTPDGALVNFAKKLHTGVIAPVGLVVNVLIGLLQNPVSGSIIPDGSLTKKTSHFLAGLLTPAGQLLKKTLKSLAGSLTPAGALVSILVELDQNFVSGSITPTGILVRKALKSLTGSITPDGALANFAKKVHAGSITPDGFLVSVELGKETFLAGVLAPTGNLQSQIFKILRGQILPVGTVTSIFLPLLPPLLFGTALENLRKNSHTADLRLTVFNPTVLLAAQVDGNLARGEVDIPYTSGTGSFAEIEQWMQVYVGSSPGLSDVGVFRVRTITGSATSGTLGVDTNGIPWTGGLFITVFNFFAPFVLSPAFIYGEAAENTFFKLTDILYQNSDDANTKPKPVCIAGTARVSDLFLTTPAVFDFDLTDSYAITQGATAAGSSPYSLSISPTAGTTVVFDQDSGVGDITITLPGHFWVTATFTDSNNKTAFRKVPVVVHDRSFQPYLDFSMTGLTTTYGGGTTFDIEAWGDVRLQDFPDGALAILWTEGDKPADILGTGNIVSVGYVSRDVAIESISDEGVHQVRFSCLSVDNVLANRPLDVMELTPVANPTTWYEYANWLYMGAAVDHIFEWHSSVKIIADVLSLDFNLTRVGIQTGETNLKSMLDSLTYDNGVFAKITSDQVGRIHFAHDIQFDDTAGRAAVSDVFEIKTADITGDITIERQDEKSFYRLLLGGTTKSVGGGPDSEVFYMSVIPGYIRGQFTTSVFDTSGRSNTDKDRVRVASQLESNRVCGRVYAYENRQLRTLRITLRGNYLGAMSVIPGIGWYRWGIADVELSRELEINNTRFLCRSISVTSDHAGDMTMAVTLEPEVFGPDGVTARYPTSHPEYPPPEEPNWTPHASVPALLTGASAYYRSDEDSTWETLATDDLDHLHLDVWWKTIARSSQPDKATWWSSGTGFVKYYPSLRGAPANYTPYSTLEDFGFNPEPEIEDVRFTQMLSDPWQQDRKYALGWWTNTVVNAGWIWFSDTSGQSWNKVLLWDTVPATDLKPLWMAVSQDALWVTVWRDGFLVLLNFSTFDLSFVSEIQICPATFNEVTLRDQWIFPVAVLDATAAGEPLYLAGRMINPTTLTPGTYQIIKLDSAVWTSIENSWGTDHCGSLRVSTSPDVGDRTMKAIRQSSLS